MSWLITPPTLRQPQRQKELAKILNVNEATLCNWKKDPEFTDLIPDRIRRRAFDHAPEVFAALIDRAKKGSLYAIELYFKFIFQWAEPLAGVGSHPVNDNRTVIMIGGKPAESLPVGLLRAAPTPSSEVKN